MTEKEMVGVRLPNDTLGRVDQYAEEHDVSRSDAIRRLLKEGADLQETGLTVAAFNQSNQEEEDKEAVADGGQVVRPMLNFLGAFWASLSLVVFAVIGLAVSGNVVFSFLNYAELFGTMIATLLLVAVTMVIQYTSYPEKADQFLYTRVRKLPFGTSAEAGGNA